MVPEPSLERIADGVWIHKSYNEIAPWGPILSQGLVVKTDLGVVLIDTAWNDSDTKKLLALIVDETGAPPKAAIITHAHADKMGGVRALTDAGVPSFAHEWTNEDALDRGLASTAHSVRFNSEGGVRDFRDVFGRENAERGAAKIVLMYPGGGHTRDNIIVYASAGGENIVFGGCLIRPGGSDNLGNTADADIGNWANAVRAVASRFHEAEIVIPSHGAPGGRDLLDHTIALAEAAAGE